MLSRGRRATLTFPFLASVWLALCGFGAPAEGSYGVSWGGWGPHLVTLDPEGNRTSTTTPKGPTTTFEYDELGKLTKVTQPPPNPAVDPTPLVTAYAYDENRNRIRQTDANGHVVTMEYDELNRLKKTTQDPGGLNLITETVQFDENGNPLVVRDPKDQTITSTFDELNRLKTKTYAFAQGDATRPWRYTASIDYGYDENSNLLTSDEHVASGTDPPDTTLTTTRVYDGLDRLTSESQPLPDGGSRTVGYSYYKNGLRKTVTDPASSVTQYAYDGQNRLQAAITGFGTADAKTTAYTYWPDDLLKTVTYPNGVVATHGYDRADRLLTLENAKGAAPVSTYTYTYDPNGNRLSQIEVNAGQIETTGYTYDDLDRLASVTYPVDAAYPQGRVVTYGYDAVGNRIRETEKDSADALFADKQGVFDHANRLTELQDLVTPAESTNFSWDRNGNQLTKTTAGVTTENRYDLRDKLVEVVQGASTLGRFQYDAQGRRSLKIGEEGPRQYVYDQTSLFAEYDAAGSQKAKYDYGSDRLISLTRADEGRRYFSLDGLRSVVNLTDDSGTAVASYHLDTWGNFRFPTELDASRNRFAFTGHVFDTETGLYNAKARYFDPKLGRFLTQDSFLGQIDEPPSLHRYAYGWNRPTYFIDPTGHYSWNEFKSDAKWAGDFAGAFVSDLAENAPERAAKVGDAIGRNAKALVTETVANVHDAGALTLELAANQVGIDYSADLYSSTAEVAGRAIGSGDSLAHFDVTREIGINAALNTATFGIYGTGKEQYGALRDFSQGKATIADVEDRLADAAGGAVVNATLAAAASLKVTGRINLEFPNPMPQFAYANGAVVIAEARSLAVSVPKVGFGPSAPAAAATGLMMSASKPAGGGNTPKGAANPKVAKALRKGQKAHAERTYPEGFEKEVKLPSGKRMDAYNKETKQVNELKPENTRAVRRGEKQVEGYCKECDEVFGPGHTGTVETYDPAKIK